MLRPRMLLSTISGLESPNSAIGASSTPALFPLIVIFPMPPPILLLTLLPAAAVIAAAVTVAVTVPIPVSPPLPISGS